MSGYVKNKKSVLLLISMLVGLAYVAYSIYYWTGANAGNGSDTEAVGAAIATAVVMPHLVLAFLALVFNILGFFMSKPAFALTAGILYSVSLLLFPPYFWGVVLELVLCYVAFGLMHSRRNRAPAARYER